MHATGGNRDEGDRERTMSRPVWSFFFWRDGGSGAAGGGKGSSISAVVQSTPGKHSTYNGGDRHWQRVEHHSTSLSLSRLSYLVLRESFRGEAPEVLLHEANSSRFPPTPSSINLHTLRAILHTHRCFPSFSFAYMFACSPDWARRRLQCFYKGVRSSGAGGTRSLCSHSCLESFRSTENLNKGKS